MIGRLIQQKNVGLPVDDFQKVYEVKKAQLEAAYKRQQQEISQLKDFVARNKARVSTRNMAMSRQKKLDRGSSYPMTKSFTSKIYFPGVRP